VVPAVAVLLAQACGSDGSDSDDAATLTTATATPTSSGADDTTGAPTTDAATTTAAEASEFTFSVTSMLAELPASTRPAEDGTLFVTMSDLDAASELSGVGRPPADAPGDVDAVFGWLGPLTGFTTDPNAVLDVAVQLPDVVRFENLASNEEIAAEFGWSVLDVRSYAEVLDPPRSFTVLDAAVTADDLDAAIEDQRDGIWRLGGEDGSIDLPGRTAGRPLGESLRFALRDGLLGVSRSTPPVQEWLSGPGETFADDEALMTVGSALDAADVYAAMIADAPAAGLTEGEPPQATEAPIAPYDILGVGASVVDGDATGVFVYHHATADAAAANEAAIRNAFEEGLSVRSGQPISELISLDEVVVDGPVVVATVTVLERSPRVLWEMVAERDVTVAFGAGTQ
jgi:hypothetical protein